MRQHKGFSLIELLIVVAIILIIAAIAVNSYLRSRIAANEAAAVSAIRTVNTAQISYNSSYPTVGYAATLGNLGGSGGVCNPPGPAHACLIDDILATAPHKKNGYIFSLSNVTGTPNATYTVIGAPVSLDATGTRYFCSYEDAVVRFSTAALAACDNTVTPLQ